MTDNAKNVYEVTDKTTKKKAYVRARGVQTAIDHITRGRFEGRLLKGGEVVDLYEAGTTIETAGEKEQSDPSPLPEPEAPLKPEPTGERVHASEGVKEDAGA